MTDQNPNDSTPPSGDPFAAETNGSGAASAKSSEWLSQLQTMINDITTQAAPVARQVAAKAAELTAVAAVKAGPLAQRAAEATTDAGQKLAERAQSLAAELRAADAGGAAGGEATGFDNGAGATGQVHVDISQNLWIADSGRARRCARRRRRYGRLRVLCRVAAPC